MDNFDTLFNFDQHWQIDKVSVKKLGTHSYDTLLLSLQKPGVRRELLLHNPSQQDPLTKLHTAHSIQIAEEINYDQEFGAIRLRFQADQQHDVFFDTMSVIS